jgi:signal transduction histidine kinase
MSEELLNMIEKEELDTLYLLQNLVNNCGLSIVIKDEQYRAIWANQLYQEKLAIPLTELKEKACYRLLFDLEKPCVDCPLNTAITTGQSATSTITIPDDISYLIHVFPVKNSRQEIYAYMQTLLHITSNEEMNDDRLTSLAHELKTPLTVIHSTLQVLESKLGKSLIDTDYLAEKMTILKQYSSRLEKLVNYLLDTNKLESGKHRQYINNYNITNIIEKVVYSFTDLINKQGKKLQFNTDISIKYIACDILDIERIILNLLSNAIKFTEPGDIITVTMTEIRDNIQITIKDTGTGIPLSQQQHIFNKFYQADQDLNRTKQGSGLGLFIVKKLLDLHQGTISLISSPGQGSEFIINLPVNIVTEENSKENVKLRLINTLNQ